MLVEDKGQSLDSCRVEWLGGDRTLPDPGNHSKFTDARVGVQTRVHAAKGKRSGKETTNRHLYFSKSQFDNIGGHYSYQELTLDASCLCVCRPLE